MNKVDTAVLRESVVPGEFDCHIWRYRPHSGSTSALLHCTGTLYWYHDAACVSYIPFVPWKLGHMPQRGLLRKADTAAVYSSLFDIFLDVSLKGLPHVVPYEVPYEVP